MESLAQKKAKANFKKAISYRKKTGCSLKEAFAHVKGKKVGSVKKRSSSPLKNKVAKKKVATKKSANPSEKSILNKIHRVKKDIDQLDKAQHKHMSIGKIKNEIINKIKHSNSEIMHYEGRIKNIQERMPKFVGVEKIVAKQLIKTYNQIIKEEKAHQRELKKQI